MHWGCRGFGVLGFTIFLGILLISTAGSTGFYSGLLQELRSWDFDVEMQGLHIGPCSKYILPHLGTGLAYSKGLSTLAQKRVTFQLW